MKNYRGFLIAVLAVFGITALFELWMGRLPLGPDGRFGWWEGNIWSSEQSQRFADPYSLSHIEHGLWFFAFLWLVAKKVPLRYRFLIALLIEAAWEMLENSPIIINRYRAMTIAQGYVGDSILNSLSDILMMVLGFLIASRARLWMCVILIILLEVGMLLWVRDNLALNVIMLIYPIMAIKQWQMMGKP